MSFHIIETVNHKRFMNFVLKMSFAVPVIGNELRSLMLVKRFELNKEVLKENKEVADERTVRTEENID